MKGPKLRKLHRYPIERDGEALLVLQDPHRLDDPLAVDPILGDYLDMMDGKRSVAQLRQSMLLRGKPALSIDELEAVVQTLAECGFLDDDHFRARWALALREFQDRPALAPTLAGVAYPQDSQRVAQDFAALLGPSYGQAIGALLWPYSPYPFTPDNPEAQGALAALPDPASLDGILLLSSSHHDGATPYQLLDKDFQTLLGPVPGAKDLAQALIRPRPWLCQEPLRWKGEQSLEVPLLALRARYAQACPPVLPLLCGRACFATKQDEDQVLQSASLLAELENLLLTGRWLLIASAQLGHAKAQADPQSPHPLDTHLIQALSRKEQRAFFPARLAKVPSQERPIGAPVLATLLSLLPPAWRCKSARHRRPLAIDQATSIGHAYLQYGC